MRSIALLAGAPGVAQPVTQSAGFDFTCIRRHLRTAPGAADRSELNRRLAFAEGVARQMGRLYMASVATMPIPAPVTSFGSRALARSILRHLGTEGHALIPAGPPGHAMLLELIKDPPQGAGTYTIRIYNSGDGLFDHHQKFERSSAQTARKYRTMYQVGGAKLGPGKNRINVEELQTLVEAKTRCVQSFLRDTLLCDGVDALYRWADRKGVPERIESVAQTEQKARDCGAEVVMAYLRNNMSSLDFKQEKAALLEEALEALEAKKRVRDSLAFIGLFGPTWVGRKRDLEKRLRGKAERCRERADALAVRAAARRS